MFFRTIDAGHTEALGTRSLLPQKNASTPSPSFSINTVRLTQSRRIITGDFLSKTPKRDKSKKNDEHMYIEKT
jgi:hypothetical protein